MMQEVAATAFLPVSEDSLALVFANEFHERARFDHDSGKWFIWDGNRWRRNKTLLAVEWCRNVCRNAAAIDDSAAKVLGRYATVAGVEKLARTDERMSVTAEIFDKDPWLLGTPDGVLDLRDGSMRRADPGDFITRLAGTSPAAAGTKPELWLKFLHEATGGDQKYIDYLQEISGYCLSGKTTEHALFFIYGPGGNGKSVFLNVLRGILGEYAVTSPIDTFMATRTPQHSTDIAMLAGARLVTASETDSGRQWAEAKVKSLTGGDPISARFMRQDNFTFLPQFKLLIAGNHKPSLRTVDEANRRRFRLLPFTVTPANKDTELEEKLKVEWPAILRWMVEGCLQWQAEGLSPPEQVSAATAQYFADQDSLSQWLDERCERNSPELLEAGIHSSMVSCGSSVLFADWKSWCDANGENAGTNKSFSEMLERHGFLKKPTKNGKFFYGVALKPKNEDDKRYGN